LDSSLTNDNSFCVQIKYSLGYGDGRGFSYVFIERCVHRKKMKWRKKDLVIIWSLSNNLISFEVCHLEQKERGRRGL